MCECWNLEWDRWNTKDERRCASDCACRCHVLEEDFLLAERRNSENVKKISALTLKVLNLEERYEPVQTGGRLGTVACRCEKPKYFCADCKGHKDQLA